MLQRSSVGEENISNTWRNRYSSRHPYRLSLISGANLHVGNAAPFHDDDYDGCRASVEKLLLENTA